VTFRDEHGVELFDLPEAPRPDPDTPAPPRLLYDFDNLQFGHADRSRVITQDYIRQDFDPNGPMPCIVLVDGFTAGRWTIEKGTLTIQPFVKLSKADRAGIEKEGAGLLAFAAAKAKAHDVRFLPVR
jgi:hypothetical protein